MDEATKSAQERALNRQEPNWQPEDFEHRGDMLTKVKTPEWSGEKCLDIEVIFEPELLDAGRRSRYPWTAHYQHKPKDFGQGTTPYMAILDLINNLNPTIEVGNAKRTP